MLAPFPIFLNANTMLAIACGVLCGFGMHSLFKIAPLTLMSGAVSAGAFDLLMRLRDKEEDAPIIHPNSGGHIWFIPMWVIATVMAVTAALFWAGVV